MKLNDYWAGLFMGVTLFLLLGVILNQCGYPA